MSFIFKLKSGVPERIARCLTLVTLSTLSFFLLVACEREQREAADPEVGQVPGRTLTVEGTGQAKAQPDVTLVTFGFWVKEEDANLAIGNSAARLAEIAAGLNNLGIDAADIEAPGASISSEKILGADGYPTNRLLYAANQNVSVTIRDTSKLGDVLNSVRDLTGAPYLYSLTVQPDISAQRRSRTLAEARRLALADAMNNGAGVAEQLGLTLGQPLEVTVLSEVTNPGPMSLGQVSLQVRYALDG